MAVPDAAEVADAAAKGGHGEPDVADPDDPLWRAVRALPARQRVAVVHRYVLDRPYADVAEALGTTEETARKHVSLGVKQLREEWSSDETE
jgi:DNA-directed RNA polymerase specialized sigma24 family protein